MSKRLRHVLGIALADRAIHLAELRLVRGQSQVVGQSRLDLSEPISLTDPEALGQSLADYLREHRYRCRRAVVGLPAKWLLARYRLAPTVADENARRGMLRLGIEREFVGGAENLTFDYARQPTNNGQEGVLLVGGQREQLGRIQQAMETARLSVVAIVPTLLAVDAHLHRPDGSLLYIGADSVELLARRRDHVLGLWRVQLGGVAPDAAAADGSLQPAIARAMAAIPSAEDEAAEVDPELNLATVPNDDVPSTAAEALRSRFRLRDCEPVDPAAAVAATYLEGVEPAIDLAHSKMAEQPPRRLPPKWRIGLAAAAVALLIIAGVGFAWYRASARLNRLEAQHAQIRDEAAQLRQVRQRTSAAAPWFSQRPRLLECLLAITRCFPDEGRLRVTNLRLDEGLTGSAQCQAGSKEAMHALLDAMQRSPQLQQVLLRDWNEVDRGDAAVSFEVTFAYPQNPAEPS